MGSIVRKLRVPLLLLGAAAVLRSRLSLKTKSLAKTLTPGEKAIFELAKTFDDAALLLARVAFDTYSLGLLLLTVLPYRLMRALVGAETKPRQGPKFETVFITGASAGIGSGLAQKYACTGTKLYLLSCKDPELETVAETCRSLGSEVETFDVNVCDQDRMKSIVDHIESERPIDLVIANAGIAPKVCGVTEARTIFEVNVMGVLNTVLPVIEYMRKRNRGHVAFMSSLGGYAPGTNRYMTPYVATKTAIRAFGEGLRNCLGREGVGVTVICPGFTQSKMTDDLIARGCRLYSLWNNDDATSLMKEGIDANEPEVSFPAHLSIVTRIMGNMPPWQRELALPLLRFGDPFYILDKQN